MICPRCSVAEISPETNRCVLCGYAANTAGGPATAVAEPGMAAQEPRLDPIARDELAQLFNIERALDGGGLVTSYIAREAETERKIVLRSLPRQPIRDAGLEDQLLRELATAASLDHPHVVPVYRYGATPRYIWYSGKHVPGQSLGELLRASGPLELHPSLRMVEQIASALQYAHRRGIVHADVRPTNVRVDPNGWALLSGFAVGRALDRLPLTVLGGRPVRQPEYIAPEERYSRQPGPAADQYSLAVLIYECLTGTLPFDGMGPDDTEPPALTGPRPDIPEHVQLALRRALSTRPADRFQSILEFVSVLEAEPAPRPAPAPQISRPPSKRQLPARPRALPAPPTPEAHEQAPAQRPRRLSPVPAAGGGPAGRPGPTPAAAAAAAAAARPSQNQQPVLLDDQPGRWRVIVKWAAVAGLVGAGVLFVPAIFQSSGKPRPAATAPQPGGGPPRMVARDSGLQQPPVQSQPDPTASAPAARPQPAPARPAPAPAAVTPRATTPLPPPRPAPTPVTGFPQPAPSSAATPARLFVNSTPWGQVYVDGQLVGNTPQANLAIRAGSHRIRITREGFQPFERVVQLAAGQELRLTDIVLQAVGP